MTVKKVIKSVGAALMYFGIYMGWQFAVAYIATIGAVIGIISGAWGDIVKELAESGAQYSAEAMMRSLEAIEMELLEKTTAWLLEQTVLLTLIAGVLTLATYVLIFALRKKNILREVGFAKMPVLPCIGMAVLGGALNLAVSYLLALLPFPQAWWDSQALQSELLLGVQPWLMILLSVIMAPLLEEIVFRGLVHTRLKRCMPMLASMIISAWLFGVVHGTIIAFIYASALGFILAWVMEKYKSLIAPILVHFGFNLCAVIIDGFAEIPDAVCFAAIAVSIGGIVLVQLTAKNKIEFTMPNKSEAQGEGQ